MQTTLYGYIGYFGCEYITSFSPYLHKDSEHFDGKALDIFRRISCKVKYR